jgi:hypothetical protein
MSCGIKKLINWYAIDTKITIIIIIIIIIITVNSGLPEEVWVKPGPTPMQRNLPIYDDSWVG